jgi:CDGSH-type Zn-finger protein
MSEKAVIAQKAPYAADVVEGEKYRWCACGNSAKQPFCDGSHRGSEFKPVVFTAEKTAKVYLCGCKQTASQPMCDGTHKSL